MNEQDNPLVKGGDEGLKDLLEETAAEEARPPCPTPEELQKQLLAETKAEVARNPARPTMDPVGRAMLNDAIVSEPAPPGYDGDPTDLDLPGDGLAGD